MKKLTFLSALLVLVISSLSCTGQGNNSSTGKGIDSKKVTVYYFHFTRRCATCMAVEENARKSLESQYPDEVKSGDYSFISLNLDEEGTKETADKLGVGGQTMLVVRGDRKIDITAAAWMSARDSEKMQAEIKSGVEKVLE